MAPPGDRRRFAGDYMLTSQGDQQQIFVNNIEKASTSLSVLSLSQAVDDTAWAHGPGVLYGSDSKNHAVDALGGTFPSDPIVAVTRVAQTLRRPRARPTTSARSIHEPARSPRCR